jgi:predicted nucleic acid-binding protein
MSGDSATPRAAVGGPKRALLIRREMPSLLDNRNSELVPRDIYEHLEANAPRRIPRDPKDWPTVALALAPDAGILTTDYDFLGCG